jgi:hypothetical protein
VSSNSRRVPLSGQREFLTQGLSILVASRDAANRPAVTRACGCAVLDDGTTLVFVHPKRAAQVLDCVSATGAVAAVFSEPETHRTVQLKSADARVVPDCRQYSALLADYREKFTARLAKLGYSKSMARKLAGDDHDEFAAIAFAPTAIFDQTPGPNAGAAIGSG